VDNGDDQNNPARLKSHIHTGEWQSFEVRMRRRRVDRLIVRAETALADGNTDEVREALEEARRLAPGVPQIAALEHALELPPADLPLNAADDGRPNAAPQIIDAVPIERSRYRGALAAAAVLTIGIAGAAGWIYRSGSTAAPFTLAPQLTQTTPTASGDPHTSAPADGSAQAASTRVLVETVNASAVGELADPAPLDATAQVAPVRLAEVEHTEPTPAATTGAGAPAAPPREFEAVPATFAERTASLPALDAVPSTMIAGSRTPMPLPTPDLKLASRPEAVARPERASDTSSVVVVAEDAAVRGVLNRYATAYSRLDAGAAQEVWPAVNRSALSRAFDGLASQQVSLERCAVDVRGTTAQATCAGSATWSPKIGNGGLKTEPRNWTFQLAKAGQGWQIVSARVQNK
jgi:hypothetical protein